MRLTICGLCRRVCAQGMHCQGNARARFSAESQKVADYYSHDLEKLVRLAAPEFEEDRNADTILAGYWDLVTRWNEESRYELHRADAEKLAEGILLAISDAEHGVLKCLSKY